MSLFRQLWLSIISLTVFVFLGSFLVSVLSARNYLEEQLLIKNGDNAAALALSLSQLQEKDPVTVELMVSAQFDTGHYQAIVLTDPHKQVMVERRDTSPVQGAPAWFVKLFPIHTQPGIAQVQDGWRQFATVSVLSHSQFAYRELWRGTMGMVAWFFIAALLAGVIGTWLLRFITRPLNQVVDQANALTERRFTTVAEPRAFELKAVIRAMNSMVERIKQMFAEETARLDALRKQLNRDPVTDLANRDYFLRHLREALESDDSAPNGVLVMMRLKDLATINAELGHQGTDTLLRAIGDLFRGLCASHEKWLPARLKGPDFAILAQGQTEASNLAGRLGESLTALQAQHYPGLGDLFAIGALRYKRGDNMGAQLAGVDQILAKAELQGANTWLAQEGDASGLAALPAEAWRELIAQALNEKRIKLIQFPVVDAQGVRPLHHEGVMRMQTETGGPWRPAGDFMHFAVRLNLTKSLDLGVVQLALAELRRQPGNYAINLSAETIADWSFHSQLVDLLKGQRDLCQRLWVEVPVYGALHHLDAFRELCRTLKLLGCKVGIERFGRKLSEFNKFADVGVDYVKVDTNFVRGIDQNPGNQELLRGLCKMVHNLGILAIAVGVETEAEQATITALGFDGSTGPAIKPAG
jgi:EAL domain-containing protein (putative c-di-GMP-specific phosphodiesterase class I)/GGDEF domain-containing protein